MAQSRTAALAVLRLAGLLALVALATSRIGLLAHELVGHGGAAVAVGAKVTEVQLFWFAGGWIRYQLAAPAVAPALAIAMGGIAVELVCGMVLVLAVRGDGLGRKLVRGIGAALVLHGSWYLATGAWHGYGDGVQLYHELGDARYPVAIAAGLVTCTAGYFGARGVFGALAETLPSTRVIGVLAAVLLAAGLHVALAAGEVHVRRDTTYVQIMQPEKDRLVERDLARWAEYQRTHGGDLSEQARAAQATKLEREHTTFPFKWLLAIAAGVAAIVGAARSRRTGPVAHIGARLYWIAAASAVISIGAVIAIDLIAR